MWRGPGRVRPIRLLDDPVLRTPCEPVTAFDRELATLVADMMATMDAAEGVGLAANQIGVSLRVFVYDCADGSGKRRKGHVVNPALEPPPDSSPVDSVDEGCLSVPGQHARLTRPTRARVSGFDRTGRAIQVAGTGLLARCLAHEVDHLDGTLFVDRLSRQARAALLRAYRPPTDPYPAGSAPISLS